MLLLLMNWGSITLFRNFASMGWPLHQNRLVWSSRFGVLSWFVLGWVIKLVILISFLGVWCLFMARWWTHSEQGWIYLLRWVAWWLLAICLSHQVLELSGGLVLTNERRLILVPCRHRSLKSVIVIKDQTWKSFQNRLSFFSGHSWLLLLRLSNTRNVVKLVQNGPIVVFFLTIITNHHFLLLSNRSHHRLLQRRIAKYIDITGPRNNLITSKISSTYFIIYRCRTLLIHEWTYHLRLSRV